MNFIVRKKWFVIVAWILLLGLLFFTSPNLGALVEEKGQITVPNEYSSSIAEQILAEVNEEEGGEGDTQVALVFYSDKPLTENEIKEAEKAINILEEQKEKLGITKILSHFNDDRLEEKLVSKDGKAILASIHLMENEREASELKKELYKVIEDIKVDHVYTSEWLINLDLIESSQVGLKKTEGIAVVFILLVLLLVYRSFIAPIIPLLSVGISYLASQSIVAILVDKFDFPLSTYTQIFLVVVLFGIGTDYCILLLSRFKEELSTQETVTQAIVETYKTAGHTILYSGIAVMIGFAAIGLSQFILYQSAVAVGIGVAMLLLALFTIVPFFMSLLGGKIFWPSKAKAEHGESKIWSLTGHFSLTRPFISLMVVAIICVPLLLTYDGTLSFNSMEEISDDYGSIKAFNVISGSFSPGEAMPTQVVLKNDEEMDSQEYLSLAEKISQELKKVDLVDSVRSVTRPTGESLEDFLVAKQVKTLEEGLGEGKDGIQKISSGLAEASSKLEDSKPELEKATDGVGELISGTEQLQNGLTELKTNLAKIEQGMRQGSQGSEQIKNGLEQAKAGAEELLSGYQQLYGGYTTLQTNLSTLHSNYEQIGDGISQLSNGLSQYHQTLFGYLEGTNANLLNDPQYLGLKEASKMFPSQLTELASGVKQLNNGLNTISEKMKEANNGLSKAIEGQKQFGSGLEALIQGIDKQLAGLTQLADGQNQVVNYMQKATIGASKLTDGQKQLLDGFSQIDNQLNLLTDGLKASTDGLNQVSDGLGSAQEYLHGLSNSSDSGFYLPKEVFESEDFAEVLDTYLSKNRKVMTFDIVFETNPYSNEAIKQVDEIKKAVARATKDTKLENAQVAIGGISSMNNDLKTMSDQDFSRTATFMLIGIAFILVILFKSMIMPIYIIGSLILTYYTAMSVNELIFVNMLGYSGTSWAVPFFAFCLLIVLGVDYSIFLMNRFNEYKDLLVTQAMFMALKKMGVVILSAAIILGGTFAAMLPSGMLSLLQIATITICGLFLYACVILPLFIPVMVKIFGEANWWPFKRA